MTRMLRALCVLLALMIGAAAGAEPVPAPRPRAVWFYADWCLNCKLIAPKLEQAQEGFETRVHFVKLDFTREESRGRNRQLARELGFYELYQSNKATGWVALLTPEGQLRGALRQAMSVEEMRAALAQLAAADRR